MSGERDIMSIDRTEEAGERWSPWNPAATDHGCDPIPRGIGWLEPGAELAEMLESVRGHRLSEYHQWLVLQARQRMVSYHTAGVLDDVAAMVTARINAAHPDTADSIVYNSAVAEIAVALTLTRRAAERKVALAMEIQHRLPQVKELLRQGRIDEPRAHVMASTTSHLDADAARSIIDEISESASELTTGQLRGLIRRLCIERFPEEAAERYDAAIRTRRLVVHSTDAGTAHLHCLDLPPDRVAEITSRINTIATSMRRNGEERTMDQLRVDVLMDLLAGTHDSGAGQGSSRGSVDLRVDLTTLAELDDHPGHLAGYGPVIADVARQTARIRQDAEFRFLVTDDDGNPVAMGTTKHRPVDPEPSARRKRALSPGERRIVEMLRPTCAFPGCSMPAIDSDMDHIVDYAKGGETEVANSAPLCRHHNNVKTCGWRYELIAGDQYCWTTPSGHTITSGPDP